MYESQFLFSLAVILISAKIFGGLSSRLGLPSVLGEITAGLFLGPSLLNFIHPDNSLILTGFIGIVILMFYTGIETDTIQLRKVGKAAFWSAFLGVILPFICGYFFSKFMGLDTVSSLFIGTILTATSVSITAHSLIDLGQLHGKEGSTILGAALIDDIMGVIVLSCVVAYQSKSNPFFSIMHVAVFFVGALVLGRILQRCIKYWHAHEHQTETEVAIAISMAFLYAWAAQELGSLAAISGAFLVGLLLNNSPERQQISSSLKMIGSSFFVPIFFVIVGVEVNIHTFSILSPYFIGLVIIAIVTKVAGCYLGAKLSHFTHIESLRVGVGMISRGEVALIVAAVALQGKFINNELFTATIGMTLITSLLTPILLKFLYKRSTGDENKALNMEIESDMQAPEVYESELKAS